MALASCSIFVIITKEKKSLGIAFTGIFSRDTVIFIIDLYRSIEPSPNIKSVLPPEVVVNSRETEVFEFFVHSRKQEGRTIEKHVFRVEVYFAGAGGRVRRNQFDPETKRGQL